MSDGAREQKFIEHRSRRDLFHRPTEFYYIKICSLLIMKRLGTIIMSHLFTLIHSDDQFGWLVKLFRIVGRGRS